MSGQGVCSGQRQRESHQRFKVMQAHDTCPDLRRGQCFAVMCKRRQLIVLRGLKLMQLKAVLLSAKYFK